MPTSTHYTKVFPSYVNRIRIYFQRTVEVCHYIGLQRRGRTAVICDRCMRPTFPSGACCFTATVCHHYSFLCPFIHFTFFDWREELSSLRMTSTVMAMRLQSAVANVVIQGSKLEPIVLNVHVIDLPMLLLMIQIKPDSCLLVFFIRFKIRSQSELQSHVLQLSLFKKVQAFLQSIEKTAPGNKHSRMFRMIMYTYLQK